MDRFQRLLPASFLRLVLLPTAGCLLLLPRPMAAQSSSVCTDSAADAVVEKLHAMRDVYSEMASDLKAFYVTGKVVPGDLRFTIAVEDGKWRLDRETFGLDEKKVTIVRLYDGENFFRVNQDAVGVLSPDDVEKEIREDSVILYSLFMCPVYEGLSTPSEVCAFYSDAILGRGQFDESYYAPGRRILCLEENDGLITLDDPEREEGGTSGVSQTCVLDSKYDFSVVQFDRTRWGMSDGKEVWRDTLHVETEYMEVLPGLFFVKSGRYSKVTSGERAIESNTAGTNEYTLRIDEVRLVDLDLPERYFDIHSLGIDNGTLVQDARFTPNRFYVYGNTPLDGDFLSSSVWSLSPTEAVRKLPSKLEARRAPARTHWLLTLNVVVFVVLVAAFIVRRRFRSMAR